MPRCSLPFFVGILGILIAGCSASPRHLDEALAGQPPGTYAYFQTNFGDFLARLFVQRAPRTTANFIGLAEGTKQWLDPESKQQVQRPFYDGLLFFRVIQNVLVQTGDPLNLGISGPGYSLEDELHVELRHDRPGILSMATTDEPNSGGSQFIITLGPLPHLDNRGSVFGEVVWGMETLEKIGDVPTVARNRPVRDVRLQRVTIHRADDAPTTTTQ